MTTPPLNSVQPDLGGSPGWDRPLLSELLTLSPLEGGRLTSQHAESNGNGTVFGGQLIGQALAAAAYDIPEELSAQCLQLTFLAPGKTTENLQFDVQRLLTGRNFTVQQVLCTQGNRNISSAQVSFHRGEEGPEHALPMPAGLPGPESLPTLGELVLQHAQELQIDAAAQARVGHSRNLEMRPINGRQFLLERNLSGQLRYWIRTCQSLPDRPALHQAALGYLTDYWFPMTALMPHLGAKVNSGLYVASLNHTIWFHAPLRADAWLLVDAQVKRTSNGRGLTEGHVYSADGLMVATITQETLFRGWGQRAGIPAR